MTIGGDFFRILSFAIQIMRLFGKLFGDDKDKQEIADSEARTMDGDSAHSC